MQAADAQAAEVHARTVLEVSKRAGRLWGRGITLEKRARKLKGQLSDLSLAEAQTLLEGVLDERDAIRESQCALAAAAMSWRHSADEVYGWCERALEMGCSFPMIDTRVIRDLMYERVTPNAPFRARLLELQGNSPGQPGDGDFVREASEALGRDTSVVGRLLGMRSRPGRPNSSPSLSLFIEYAEAVVFARVFGMKPIDAGI